MKLMNLGLLLIWINCAALAAGQTLSPQRVIDLDSQPHALLAPPARATVIIFLGTQCPISNRYIPTLNDLAKAHENDGVAIFAVVSDPIVTRKDVIAYRDQYKIASPLVFDSSGSLARELKPTATPEAFVFDQNGELKYRGRIDSSFASLGKINQVVKSHDLVDAIAAVLADHDVAVARTEVVGCPIEINYATTQPASVTYTRDIAPILDANCVSCHRENQIAPFPLTDYKDAAKRANFLTEVTASRYMPPWKPAENFGHFLGEHRLSEHEIALIKTWAAGGAALGDPADLPPLPTFASGWTLGEPDLLVKMPQAFTISAGGPDVYRAFVAPLNVPEDCYVAGIEFRPQAKTVVHHAILYLDDSGAARKLDDADPAPGYKSFGGPGFTPSGALGGWAPGATPHLLPDGVGRLLRKNSDLILQIHYHPDGREHTDQSSVAIYFQKKPIRQVLASFVLITRDINIPAGEANYTRTVTTTLPTDLSVMGIVPHMHLIGREMKVQATTPEGKVIPLIWIKDWDFKWQGQYQFAEPMVLKKGTKIQMTARYDNTDANPDNPNNPPQRVTHGEQTTDEMCICFIEFLANNPLEAYQIRRQVTREMIAETIQRKMMGEQ